MTPNAIHFIHYSLKDSSKCRPEILILANHFLSEEKVVKYDFRTQKLYVYLDEDYYLYNQPCYIITMDQHDSSCPFVYMNVDMENNSTSVWDGHIEKGKFNAIYRSLSKALDNVHSDIEIDINEETDPIWEQHFEAVRKEFKYSD